jgi:hypothetical protein
VSTADISVFALQRLYTLSLYPQFVSPDLLEVASLLNTFEMVARDPLRGLYKYSLTYDNPLRFQAKTVITLPNETDALTKIISYP